MKAEANSVALKTKSAPNIGCSLCFKNILNILMCYLQIQNITRYITFDQLSKEAGTF